MKKLLLVCLIGMMCFVTAGCSNSSSAIDSGGNQEPSEGSETQIEDSVDQTVESVDIFNDNATYFIMIDGQKFYAGDPISALSDVGYSLEEFGSDEELPAGKYIIGTGSMVNADGKTAFGVTPYNNTDTTLTVSECVIGGIGVSDAWVNDDERVLSFEFYGGIKLGSTKEDVVAAWGEPTSTLSGEVADEKWEKYEYESDETYRNFSVRFDSDGFVTSMDWQNMDFND